MIQFVKASGEFRCHDVWGEMLI